MSTRGLRPRTVPWTQVCAVGHHQPLSSASQRILALDRAALCKGDCDELTQRAVEALAGVKKDLASDLHTRAVLCDSRAPCRVSSAREGWELTVCLPRAVPTGDAPARFDNRAYLCEPYGELWQQVGASTGNFTPDGCVSFNLRLVVAWWQRLRSTSPFFAQRRRGEDAPGGSARRFAKDQRVTGERFTNYKPVPSLEYRTPGRWLGSRPPPLTPDEKARKLSAEARFTAAYLAFLDEVDERERVSAAQTAASGRRPPYARALAYEQCAFVGSGWSLNCGTPKGAAIDGADAVFRANSFQHQPSPAGESGVA